MKYYNSIHTIPIWNIIQIQRSINDGKSDFRYMIINSDKKIPRRVNLLECKKAYDNIIYQMHEININISRKWGLYIAELRRMKIKNEINNHLEALGKRRKKLDMNRVNISFGNYLDELELKHKDFQFRLYSLRKNYLELWDKLYPTTKIPQKLIDNKDMNFFLFEEYFDLLADFTEPEELIPAMIMITPTFVEQFIKSEVKKYDKIRWLEKRLNKFFISIKDPKKWKLIRTDFFSTSRIKCVPISDNTLIDQVIIFRDMMNQSIDLNKTTYSELERIEVQAKEKNKRETKKRPLDA